MNNIDNQLKQKALDKIILSTKATMEFKGLEASSEANEKEIIDVSQEDLECYNIAFSIKYKDNSMETYCIDKGGRPRLIVEGKEIIIAPKVKDGKVLLDKNSKDHRYIMEEEE